jgi:chromosome partitioning protein
MTSPNIAPILEGNLRDFNLIEILQVLSVSRQYTRIELFAAERTPAGSIFIKSGKVVQASVAELSGKAAFLKLLRRQPTWFEVFRINTPALIPEPIGSLSNLLFEALEAEDALPPVPAEPPATHAEASLSVATAIEPEAPSAPEASEAEAPRSAPTAIPEASEPDTQIPSAAVHVDQPVVAKRPEIPPAPLRKAEPRAVKRTHSGVRATKAATGPCIIGLASPKGGSGKTTVALNLALSLARREHSVILVDGDVNGDVMSSIDGRASAKAGVFDVLTGRAAPAEALRKTVVQNLQILPAIGQSLPSPELSFHDYRDQWKLLLNDLATRAEIVLVDTPAGMFGVTFQILSGCTHVLGVLQAEVIAQRSFSMFADCLELLPEEARPAVLGVFLNMLQLSHNASISVLEQACENLPHDWLFETSIPRNPAFLDATAAGVPLHLYDPKNPPAVSWLFDTLATEVIDRLALGARELAQERRFLA